MQLHGIVVVGLVAGALIGWAGVTQAADQQAPPTPGAYDAPPEAWRTQQMDSVVYDQEGNPVKFETTALDGSQATIRGAASDGRYETVGGLKAVQEQTKVEWFTIGTTGKATQATSTVIEPSDAGVAPSEEELYVPDDLNTP